MTKEGHGVVFISHKMNEVLSETRRVTVLRRGRNAGVVTTAGTTGAELAEMMMGRKISLALNRRRLRVGASVFEADDVRSLNDRGLDAVCGVSFRLRRGEILGIAGIAGNGQRELCETLVGLRALTAGTVKMRGQDLTNASPRRFIDLGVRYIPADRRGVGMVPAMDVNSNVILRKYWSKPVAAGLFGIFIDWRQSEALSMRIIEDFNVSVPSPRTPVRNLSGGNLQKFLMGRELADFPEVIIMMHPTWGLDVAAAGYVRERILAQREAGTAMLLISEDLDELLALSDRLAVMYRGKFMGVIAEPESVPVGKIGLMMAGTWISEALKYGGEVKNTAEASVL
jgi:simple sugar transport system ATP-binding protein